eukprot:385101_1
MAVERSLTSEEIMSCEDLRKQLDYLIKVSTNDQDFYDFQCSKKYHIKRILSNSSRKLSNKIVHVLNDKFKDPKSDLNWTSIVATIGLQLERIANTVHSTDTKIEETFAAFLKRYFCELFDFLKYLFRNGLNPSIHYTKQGEKRRSFESMQHIFTALKTFYPGDDSEVIKQINEILFPQFDDIMPSLLTVLHKEELKLISHFWFGSMMNADDIDTMAPAMLQNLLLLGYPMIDVVCLTQDVSYYDHAMYGAHAWYDSNACRILNPHSFYYSDHLAKLCVIHQIARQKMWKTLHYNQRAISNTNLPPHCVMNIILDYHMGPTIHVCVTISQFPSRSSVWRNTYPNIATNNIGMGTDVNLTTLKRNNWHWIWKRMDWPWFFENIEISELNKYNVDFYQAIFAKIQNVNHIAISPRVIHLLIDNYYQTMQKILIHRNAKYIYYADPAPMIQYFLWFQLLMNDKICFYSDGWSKMLDLSFDMGIHFAHYVMDIVFTKYHWIEDVKCTNKDPIWCFVQLLLKRKYFQTIFVDCCYLKSLCLRQRNVHKLKLLIYHDLIPNHYALSCGRIICILQTLSMKQHLTDLLCIELLLWWALQQCKKCKNVHRTAQEYVAYLGCCETQCDIFTGYLQRFQEAVKS